jgi:hypothetical protein
MEPHTTLGMSILAAILSLTASKSKWYYQKLVENNDEKFANKIIKVHKICGYLLLGVSLLWLVDIYFSK